MAKKSDIDLGEELRGIRKALQALVQLQRADARRVARFEREAQREAKASAAHTRNLERIRKQQSTGDWKKPVGHGDSPW